MSSEPLADIENDASQPARCPRCGKSLTDPVLRVKDDAMQEYVRCMLGGRAYVKTFKMLAGSLYITFEEPTAFAEMNSSLPVYSKALAEDRYILLTLSSVDLVDQEAGTTKTVYAKKASERPDLIKDIESSMQQLAGQLTSTQMSLIRHCSQVFAAFLGLVQAEVYSEDFYEGAGLF